LDSCLWVAGDCLAFSSCELAKCEISSEGSVNLLNRMPPSSSFP
jgi:hypothetical protein